MEHQPSVSKDPGGPQLLRLPGCSEGFGDSAPPCQESHTAASSKRVSRLLGPPQGTPSLGAGNSRVCGVTEDGKYVECLFLSSQTSEPSLLDIKRVSKREDPQAFTGPRLASEPTELAVSMKRSGLAWSRATSLSAPDTQRRCLQAPQCEQRPPDCKTTTCWFCILRRTRVIGASTFYREA